MSRSRAFDPMGLQRSLGIMLRSSSTIDEINSYIQVSLAILRRWLGLQYGRRAFDELFFDTHVSCVGLGCVS